MLQVCNTLRLHPSSIYHYTPVWLIAGCTCLSPILFLTSVLEGTRRLLKSPNRISFQGFIFQDPKTDISKALPNMTARKDDS